MKILCVLYPDPETGYPPKYLRDEIPKLEKYPNGQTLPSPKGLDFTPGELVGCVSGELGLRKFLEAAGHTFIVTSDKEGDDSEFDRELGDADVVISQPFYPAYLTRERLEKAKKLKLAITAGIGSDHVDLAAANDHKVTVAEVTFSNSIAVAEHAVMMVLALVRDYIAQHDIVRGGGWHIADAVQHSYDLEGMSVGVLGAGRIGLAVLKRLHPFDVKLSYTDRHQVDAETSKQLGLVYHKDVNDLVTNLDVLVVVAPLTDETRGMLDAKLVSKMNRGAYIVNPARGAIANRDDVITALENGTLAGYAGDVWYPQPAPKDHPWRTMPRHGMTPHTSGSSLNSQAKYAAGTREILEDFFAGKDIRDEYIIVKDGNYKGTGAHSYAKQ